MLKELIKLANDLDERGYREEANALDQVIKTAGPIEWAKKKYNELTEPTPMEIAERQEEYKERKAGLQKRLSQLQAHYKELEASYGFFSANLFVSTPDAKFPLMTPKLLLGRAGFNSFLRGRGEHNLVYFASGTEFDSFKDEKKATNGEHFTLSEAVEFLKDNMRWTQKSIKSYEEDLIELEEDMHD